MADLKVNIAGVELANPLIAASGTFGFGREYAEFYPLSTLGGISCKGITLQERPGNPPPLPGPETDRSPPAGGCRPGAVPGCRSGER